MHLAFPTIHQLRRLKAFRTSDEALAAYRGSTVESVTPRVVADGDSHRILLPGDPGYDEA